MRGILDLLQAPASIDLKDAAGIALRRGVR